MGTAPFTDLFRTERLKYRVLRALVENEVKTADQLRRNRAEIRCRGDGQQNLFGAAIQTNLQGIGKFIDLQHRSCNADIPENGEAACCRLCQGNGAQRDQGWQRQLLRHTDALQILIVDNIIL